MRIIAGKWRGRTLAAPQGLATRPTSDRVREALFSMLQSRIGSFEGLVVADIFAGSGALGLEALSRGAAHCFFVESDPAAQQAIRRNVEALEADAELVPGKAEHLRLGETIDLAFLDPPYGSGVAASVIERLALAPGGWVSVETGRSEAVSAEGCQLEAERRYGKARITLLRRSASA